MHCTVRRRCSVAMGILTKWSKYAVNIVFEILISDFYYLQARSFTHRAFISLLGRAQCDIAADGNYNF